MTLVQWFQTFSSETLDCFARFFNFLVTPLCFMIILAIFFLFLSKENAYKLGIGYAVSFLISDLFLKNIIRRERPFIVLEDKTITANASFFTTFSCPSSNILNLAGFSTNFILFNKKQFIESQKKSLQNPLYEEMNIASKNKKKFLFKQTMLVVFLSIAICLVAISKIYLTQNYLLDVILGALIGITIYYGIFKFFNFKFNYYHLIALIFPLILLIVYGNQWFNTTGFTFAFEFSGIFTALLIGYFIEEKFIKYQIKNNLILNLFKISVTTFVMTLYYFLVKYLPTYQILYFIKYFVAGMIIFTLLPLLFKWAEKYFYTFSPDIKKDKVVFSSISLSLKQTKKVAKKIHSLLTLGEVVVLQGDLGAGKSVLVRDILQDYGVKNKITSPTFTLVNEYSVGEKYFYHFDMYRLEDEEEVKNIDFEEILDKKNAIKFIEWAEKVPDYLPEKYKKITVTKLGNRSRNIVLEEVENQ